jgi:hypothetical protein
MFQLRVGVTVLICAGADGAKGAIGAFGARFGTIMLSLVEFTGQFAAVKST